MRLQEIFNEKDSFDSLCHTYGYKYPLKNIPNAKMKRNGNIILKYEENVDLKFGDYLLTWEYESNLKNYKKYTRPILLKNGKIVSKNITGIKKVLESIGETL
jgi:hypothetical protein